METLILERDTSLYLVNACQIVRGRDDVSAAQARRLDEFDQGWTTPKGSPFITWVAGNFVESDKPNSNRQFWTAGDLDQGEESIKFSPMNMVHKFRTPVGFFADTRRVSTSKLKTVGTADAAAVDGAALDLDCPGLFDTSATRKAGSFAIQVLGGLWSHVFPFESAQVERASEEGALFFSMECRGSHLTCAGPDGCGKTFEYGAADTHCQHLLNRTSVRHIVNPIFRGGALIVPPVKPGWKGASANVVSEAVMQEAAAYAEENEAAYRSLQSDGVSLTPSAWEQLMAMVISTADDQAAKTWPVGTKVSWAYRGAIGHGTIVGIYKAGKTHATTEYKIKEIDHHKGEPAILHHYGSALRKRG